RIVGDNEVEADDRQYHVLEVVDPNYGPQTLLPQVCAFQPADTPERLELFLARLRAYPAFMAANEGVLREGIAAGLTSSRVVVERVIAQLEGMLAIPIERAVVPSMVRVAS